MRRIYGITVFLLWCCLGCGETLNFTTPPPVSVFIIKPKESDFRNYTVLKISELGQKPNCEPLYTFPDRLMKEIKGRNLFKMVQVAPPSNQDDRQTLILKLSVLELFPGKVEAGVCWGGYILIQCSLVERMTQSEIFNCRLRGPLERYMVEDQNQGLESVSNVMVKRIADIIQQGW